jgi:hypothetical protein
MKAAALTVRFLLELAALGALFITGLELVGGFTGVLVGAASVVVAAVVWGLFVAPRARIAAPTAVRLAIEVVVFVAASGGLLLVGRPAPAIALATIYLLDRIALRASGAPVFEPNPNAGGTGRLES